MSKDISSLNKTNIVSGKLHNQVPELYELEAVIENTPDSWHDNESVLDHTLLVMTALEHVFLRAKGNLKKLLNQKIDKNSRKILLKVAAILHDIGKKETIRIDEQGFTSCPNHAKVSAQKAASVLSRFNLSKEERQFVLDIISNHMDFHFMLAPENKENFQKEFVAFKNKLQNSVYPEIVLLDYADTVDGGIRKTQPQNYQNRINFYKREIEKLS